MSNVNIDIDRSCRGVSFVDAGLYRAIFGVLFALLLVRLAFRWRADQQSGNNIWLEAKRSAHATAGYAFKY